MTRASQQLPDPALENTPEKTQFVQAANERVMETTKKSRKRERGNYGHYTPESRRAELSGPGNVEIQVPPNVFLKNYERCKRIYSYND